MLFIMSIFNNNFGNILLYDIIFNILSLYVWIYMYILFYIIGLEIYFKVVVISDDFEGILFIKVREGFMM